MPCKYEPNNLNLRAHLHETQITKLEFIQKEKGSNYFDKMPLVYREFDSKYCIHYICYKLTIWYLGILPFFDMCNMFTKFEFLIIVCIFTAHDCNMLYTSLFFNRWSVDHCSFSQHMTNMLCAVMFLK
jgi:hypothetical protein